MEAALLTTPSSSTPNIQWDAIQLKSSQVYIVREDLLEGGTKERGAIPYIQDLQEEGFEEFVYASPFSGFAQVALAKSCRRLNAKCTLFAVRDPASIPERRAHAYTLHAQMSGAKIILTETLEEAEHLAAAHVRNSKAPSFKIPLGFDDPIFRNHLRVSLEKQWNYLNRELPFCPKNIWVSLGSGTLSGILRTILPDEVQIHVMDVHVLKQSDPRIQRICALPNVYYHSAVQEFCVAETVLPPIPSNQYYDAKVWKTFACKAQDGDVWWNVAR